MELRDWFNVLCIVPLLGLSFINWVLPHSPVRTYLKHREGLHDETRE